MRGRRPVRAAHPRSRGENVGESGGNFFGGGSSPLTRGKPPAFSAGGRPPRLIPAHAGKTHCQTVRFPPTKAHPRSRGENTTAALIGTLAPGSSPLTRGKPVFRQAVTKPLGLIPAHAGKTRKWCRCRSRAGAHPRSRGENGEKVGVHEWGSGSSPLTRGKLRPGREH